MSPDCGLILETICSYLNHSDSYIAIPQADVDFIVATIGALSDNLEQVGFEPPNFRTSEMFRLLYHISYCSMISRQLLRWRDSPYHHVFPQCQRFSFYCLKQIVNKIGVEQIARFELVLSVRRTDVLTIILYLHIQQTICSLLWHYVNEHPSMNINILAH